MYKVKHVQLCIEVVNRNVFKEFVKIYSSRSPFRGQKQPWKLFVFVVLGESMVGQSILLPAAVGDEIRLYNFGGDIYEDESTTTEDFLHFIGVLLYSSDRS